VQSECTAANEQTSQQANKATSKQANKPTSKQANKPTSKQANKATSKQANKPTTTFPALILVEVRPAIEPLEQPELDNLPTTL
jgi:hypothetical protein